MTDNTNILKAQIEYEVQRYVFYARQREQRSNEIRAYLDGLPPEQQCGAAMQKIGDELAALTDEAEKSALALEKKLLDYGLITGQSSEGKSKKTVQDVIDETCYDTTSIGGMTLCTIAPVGNGYEARLAFSGSAFFVKEADRIGVFEILRIHPEYVTIKHNNGARWRLHFPNHDPRGMVSDDL